MEFLGLILDIATQLIVAAITFVLGLGVARLPGSLDEYRLRKFFGDGFF